MGPSPSPAEPGPRSLLYLLPPRQSLLAPAAAWEPGTLSVPFWKPFRDISSHAQRGAEQPEMRPVSCLQVGGGRCCVCIKKF